VRRSLILVVTVIVSIVLIGLVDHASKVLRFAAGDNQGEADSVPESVSEIVIVDEGGKPRIRLGHANGTSSIQFLDSSGQPRLLLGADETNTLIRLGAASGGVIIKADSGSSRIELVDADRGSVVRIGSVTPNSPENTVVGAVGTYNSDGRLVDELSGSIGDVLAWDRIAGALWDLLSAIQGINLREHQSGTLQSLISELREDQRAQVEEVLSRSNFVRIEEIQVAVEQGEVGLKVQRGRNYLFVYQGGKHLHLEAD